MVMGSGSLLRPDLRMLRPTRRDRLRTVRGQTATTNSGFPCFDFHPLRASGGGCCPAATRRRCTTILGGHGLPRLDLWLLPWGKFVGQGPLWWGRCGRLLLHGRVRGSIRFPSRFPLPGSFFLLQKILHATFGLPRSADSGILNSVAAVVAGLSPLGGVPELAPQALCAVIQPTADNFLRRGFDFFL